MKTRKWNFPIGPQLFQPGEKKRMSIQPKCFFSAEKILANTPDAHLHAIYVGNEELLQLRGDSIALGTSLDIKSEKTAHPALDMSFEIENRSQIAQQILFNVQGVASF